jgi:hypothetical protein
MKPVTNQKAIALVLKAAKKKPLKANAIIIARFEWLKRRQIPLPTELEWPNLLVKIKKGVLVSCYFTNALSYVIKKQSYHIQILN